MTQPHERYAKVQPTVTDGSLPLEHFKPIVDRTIRKKSTERLTSSPAILTPPSSTDKEVHILTEEMLTKTLFNAL